MLTRLGIQNFQSLSDISVDLAPFTVIVGPSSSGKSALVRALHTLTHNRRGSDFISHGERQATITATTDKGTVSLTRATAAGDANAYTLIPLPTPQSPTPEQQRFTKLNGTTPEEISQFLGIWPNTGTFAGQHDKPYMLDDTPSSVASALGALTNVNVIFEAAREANRQKLSSSQTLRTRADDMERIQALIPGIQALNAQTSALTRAEDELHLAQSAEQHLTRLDSLAETERLTRGTIERLTAVAGQEVPSAESILRAQKSLDDLTHVLTTIRAHSTAQRAAQSAVTTTSAQETDVRAEYSAKLASLSTDIENYMSAKSSTLDSQSTVTIEQAAEWARDYIVTRLG